MLYTTFLIFFITVQDKLDLKISDKKENCHNGGRGSGSQKFE